MPDGTEWKAKVRDVFERAGVDEHDDEWIELHDMGVRVRARGGYRLLEDHLVPNIVEFSTLEDIASDPQQYARVEMSDSGPRLTELRFYCVDPDSRGIRQTDLRNTEVSAIVEPLVGGFMMRLHIDETERAASLQPSTDDQAFLLATRFAQRLRAGKTARDITPQLLERVAKVYRDNIDRYPTKAVQHHFQVSQRMAAEYVSRARQKGFLPPTKRGKKRA